MIAIISIGINLLMFIPAYKYRTDKLTDISYALTFVAVAVYSLLQKEISASKIVLFIMILIWAGRLGIYLLVRIRKIRRDDRFNEMREKFWNFLGFWILQGSSVFIIFIPSALFLQSEETSLSLASILGIAIWSLGFLMESVADYQKFRFKLKASNKNKWVNVGLWKYSRHPNYLGEILVWVGIFVFVFSSLNTSQLFVSFLSPLFITVLLLFVSGVPLLEKSYFLKWGNNKEYSNYKASTGKLLPKNTLPFLIILAIPQLAGVIGSFFTFSSVNTWYVNIIKPLWNPPNWVFGPVWTILYFLMGLALFIIWLNRPSKAVNKAYFWFGIQLMFNIFWSILFFGIQNIGMALIEIVLLWAFILITIRNFYAVDKRAAYLLIPYILWVSFAAVLNFSIWQLN